MTKTERFYDILRHYGKIVADKNHETIEGNFIRFTTFKYGNTHFVVTMFNGDVTMVAEKKDIQELINTKEVVD